ncbi:hypothetical protein [Thaumasiovibrio sp. DFM-14]|uniref:hypothetical protein n=1 Tax=Thaumasiovibrio sp. DFM-14 TaxID=3384792 RepID=UPI0039A05C4F
MKKMNSSYRLQLIKEVAQRRERLKDSDEMSLHISQLLESKQESAPLSQSTFADAHFDSHVGGWVSNRWDSLK